MPTHIMVDLETLGTIATSKILSLGAVAFKTSGRIESKCYTSITTSSQEERSESDDTVAWWGKQSEEAQSVLTCPDAIPLKEALEAFSKWVSYYGKDVRVWSNGANFDEPLLTHALTSHGIPIPWKFYNVRCYRTITAMHRGAVVNITRDYLASHPNVAHNALSDAEKQAHVIVQLNEAYGGKYLI